MSRFAWSWRQLLIGLAALDLLFSVGAWALAPLMFPSWDGRCASGTALVVLFGGENSHTAARVGAALKELQACPQLKGFLVGGARPERNFYGAEGMRRDLTNAGVDSSRLVSESRSFDSASNAEAVLAAAVGRPISELVLVSDTLHIARMLNVTSLAKPSPYRVSGLPAFAKADSIGFWWRPHYELVAWLLTVLPNSVQSQILKWIRR